MCGSPRISRAGICSAGVEIPSSRFEKPSSRYENPSSRYANYLAPPYEGTLTNPSPFST